MNQDQLSRAAEKLNQLLLRYAEVDAEAQQLLRQLAPLIADALAGKIVVPLDWRSIPGSIMFTEGNLRRYSDLEAAYAEFKIEATGGESPVLRKLREQRGTSRPN